MYAIYLYMLPEWHVEGWHNWWTGSVRGNDTVFLVAIKAKYWTIASLLFTAICNNSSDSHFAFFAFLFLGDSILRIFCPGKWSEMCLINLSPCKAPSASTKAVSQHLHLCPWGASVRIQSSVLQQRPASLSRHLLHYVIVLFSYWPAFPGKGQTVNPFVFAGKGKMSWSSRPPFASVKKNQFTFYISADHTK